MGFVTRDTLTGLPSNAKIVHRFARCFDWGTFGWAVTSGVQQTGGYRFFILMNSSARGPFLPSYWPVGPSTSCASIRLQAFSAREAL